MKKVAVVIGTRPEAIKQLPVIAALRRTPGLEPIVISTGQHREMLRQILDAHGERPDHELDVMRANQSLAGLTARLLEALEALFDAAPVDFCVVQGDTTSAFCASLAALYRGIPVGHVEAGLRTGNLRSPFPEEANRRLVSVLTALHFAPTARSRDALLREAVDPGSILVTGNTVVDALELELERQERDGVLASIHGALEPQLGPRYWERRFVLVTGHRRESFGRGFQEICSALLQLAQDLPDVRFVYPVHLNPNVRGPVHERLDGQSNIVLLAPQEYAAFVRLMKESWLILTDSGGVQEEAPTLDKPVLVMRENTERPEGLEAGTAMLVGTRREQIIDGVMQLFDDERSYSRMAQAKNPFGDGNAAQRIAEAILGFLGQSDR